MISLGGDDYGKTGAAFLLNRSFLRSVLLLWASLPGGQLEVELLKGMNEMENGRDFSSDDIEAEILI